jgi:excisionase family DNA binding protein
MSTFRTSVRLVDEAGTHESPFVGPRSRRILPSEKDSRGSLPVDVLTFGEAARQLGVTTNTLRAQVRRGRLLAWKSGQQWLLRRAEVERYRRESQHQNGGSDAADRISYPPARGDLLAAVEEIRGLVDFVDDRGAAELLTRCRELVEAGNASNGAAGNRRVTRHGRQVEALRVSAVAVLNSIAESSYPPKVSLRVCISAAEISLLVTLETDQLRDSTPS